MAVDLETLVAQVWSPDVRPLAEEAWRCYNAGAIRASIAATWSAVTADIIVKLIRLADEGDKGAQAFRQQVTDAQDKGLAPEGVRAMQAIEASLVDKAVDFELIDTIGKRELDRIREDRHLCSHPSLRMEGEVYNPRPEAARGHLAIALSTLLVHPPTQGRKLVEEFKNFICDPLFASSSAHIRAAFHDRVRVATRRSIIKIAALAAMLEVDPDGRMPADAHADRMAFALRAFAEVNRDAVRDAVGDTRERFQVLDGAVQLRTLVRMADDDYFWTSVDQALETRFQALLNTPITVGQWDPLPPEVASWLALVGSTYARVRLPGLTVRFDHLSDPHSEQVIAARPSEYFVPKVIDMLRTAGSWRTGERIGRLLVQHAGFLSLAMLAEALTAWYDNNQCRGAGDMPGLAAQLVHATAHLGAARGPVFTDFVTKCETDAGVGEYYSYPDLKLTLHNLDLLPPMATTPG
ncbi:hypothetical protein BS329_41590 [Amycolatopsis coloradensis]|uniref:Uncharacterized protein n=1 Tax=Amycolatopsis coloradensis TaxID=76021 RepID=A0A1R0KD11_9PSEU|nr:hypothetical protein [Amycolatopsis coloradensis]OLZ42786.1 hypothetical protein BS329_41590 [Amycolatopsis coloradensis]